MQALTYYNRHYTQKQVAGLLAKHHRTRIPRRTISRWIKKYRHICTYSQLRRQAQLLYQPDELILTHTLHHKQTYDFNLHLAKLELLKPNLEPRTFDRLRTYLESIPTDEFPHHLFQAKEDRPPDQPAERTQRSSKIQLETLEFVKTERQNLANDLATLGLILARTNRQRHPKIQEFMLINDNSTLAVEVPVYLTEENIRYYNQAPGFQLTLPEETAPITGHIDIIQVRNNLIHILDYKPDAHKIQPISQLVTYALALSSRTKLALKEFKCAWFDDKHYYEFYPLHAVYPKSTSSHG